MIVTRRRKKRFPWKRVLFPVALVAIVAVALWFEPSRAWLATGPVTGPAWRAAGPIMAPIAKPFDAMAQQRTISSQADQIDSLGKQLADARAQIADRDKQITQLHNQVDAAQQDAAVAKAARPAGKVTAPVSVATSTASAPPGSDLSQSATPDMRRTAQIWAAMDSEAAAKVVQRLPDAYVARIFALMPPDSVGALLENLPAAYAARLTQEHPELKR